MHRSVWRVSHTGQVLTTVEMNLCNHELRFIILVVVAVVISCALLSLWHIWRPITGFTDLFVWSKHEDTLSPEGVNVMVDSSCLGGLAVMMLAWNARDWGSIPHWGTLNFSVRTHCYIDLKTENSISTYYFAFYFWAYKSYHSISCSISSHN